jgi:23S rRNA pseudouridine1911/1915/1917 synthase
MSYLGYPLLGDDLYGGSLEFINRQALHCRAVAFIHPFSGREMRFEVPLAEDMGKLIIS